MSEKRKTNVTLVVGSKTTSIFVNDKEIAGMCKSATVNLDPDSFPEVILTLNPDTLVVVLSEANLELKEDDA